MSRVLLILTAASPTSPMKAQPELLAVPGKGLEGEQGDAITADA